MKTSRFVTNTALSRLISYEKLITKFSSSIEYSAETYLLSVLSSFKNADILVNILTERKG
jgi:hypothetical protein